MAASVKPWGPPSRLITIGHVEHVRDVLVLRDELCIRVDVTMDGASA